MTCKRCGKDVDHNPVHTCKRLVTPCEKAFDEVVDTEPSEDGYPDYDLFTIAWNAAIEAAWAEVQFAREQGERDMRQVKAWIEQLKEPNE